MSTTRLCLAVLSIAACRAPAPEPVAQDLRGAIADAESVAEPVADTRGEPVAEPAAPVAMELESAPPMSFADWGTERIVLPPDFAPSLPPGEEQLLFAPGMLAADAEDYWSYAFVVRIDVPTFGEADVWNFLEAYYDGLLQSVAANRDVHLGDEAAEVQLKTLEPGRYLASLRIIDSFVTMQPVDLTAKVESTAGAAGDTYLSFQVSPQPPEHPIWQALELAVDQLEL